MAEQTIDLRPEIVNVLIRRGDAWDFHVELVGEDLTGYTITAQVRADPDSTDVIATLDITDDNLTEGKFYIGQDTPTDGVYDVQVTPPTGLPRTYIAGWISTDPDVTRT